MARISCNARKAFTCWLTAIIVSLCFVTVMLLATARSASAAPAQPHHIQPQNVEPTQSLSQSQRIEHGGVPDGLSSNDWAGIQAQVAAAKYRAYQHEDGGFISSNPAHGWNIQYAEDGTTTLKPRDPDALPYYVGLKLIAVGYAGLQTPERPQQVTAEDFIVSYQWTDELREWWVNGEAGLEQWFEIKNRPKGSSNGQPLKLEMALGTDLTASQSGNALRFVDDGGTNISYNKLRVWDSTGAEIPATMRLKNSILSLVVDDRLAVYPLTIDPSFYQQAYLKASNTEGGDSFGSSVAISGDTLVVGAYHEGSNATGVNGNQADNSASYSGAAYVFTRAAGTWSQQAYLKASNAEAGDQFGSSVAISGDTLVIGAPYESSNAKGVNGDQADNSASGAGAAYVFTRIAGVWSQQVYLKASNTRDWYYSDNFGSSIAISEDTLIVGAVYESSDATGVNGDGDSYSNEKFYSGAAYVFTRAAGVWSQQAYLKASNTGLDYRFGRSVAISGDTLVVGSHGESSNATGVNGDQADNSAGGAGAAYVFTRTAGAWSQQAYLKASNTEGGDSFGSSVAISGDTLVVGAGFEDSNAKGVNGDQADNSAGGAGAAYVFTRIAGAWSQQAYLKASNTEGGDSFGSSVAISGDTLVVGAGIEDSNTTGIDGNQADNSAALSGAAYVFTRTAGLWHQQDYLKASNTRAGDRFGYLNNISISGDTLVVAAHLEDSNAIGINGDQTDNSASDAGAAYVFDLPLNTDRFAVGGNVSGLAGSGLVLQNNAGDDLSISANGSFTFATTLEDGSDYTVTVLTQPSDPSQTCEVTSGSGSLASADVADVLVTCITDPETIFSDGFEEKTIEASISVSGDDGYELFVNGGLIGSDNSWFVAETWNVSFKKGKNVVSIKGINAANGNHPGAFIADITVGQERVVTDSTWLVSTQYVDGWQEIDGSLVDSSQAIEYGSIYSTTWWNRDYDGTFLLDECEFPLDSDAMWIWTEGLNTDAEVYSRKEIFIE